MKNIFKILVSMLIMVSFFGVNTCPASIIQNILGINTTLSPHLMLGPASSTSVDINEEQTAVNEEAIRTGLDALKNYLADAGEDIYKEIFKESEQEKRLKYLGWVLSGVFAVIGWFLNNYIFSEGTLVFEIINYTLTLAEAYLGWRIGEKIEEIYKARIRIKLEQWQLNIFNKFEEIHGNLKAADSLIQSISLSKDPGKFKNTAKAISDQIEHICEKVSRHARFNQSIGNEIQKQINILNTYSKKSFNPKTWNGIKTLLKPAAKSPQKEVDLNGISYLNQSIFSKKADLESRDNESLPQPRRGQTDLVRRTIRKNLKGYEIISRLGEGGFWDVFLVKDKSGQLFTLKIKKEISTDPRSLETMRMVLEREKQISHQFKQYGRFPIIYENIIDEYTGICMQLCEYIEGLSLDDIISASRQYNFSPMEKLLILIKLVEAIKIFHTKAGSTDAKGAYSGYIHGDLSPANIMLTPQSIVKLLDFAQAKREYYANQSQKSSVGQVFTLLYSSPEMLSRSPRITNKTDIFSFAIIAYEFLSQRHPYASEIRNILNPDYEPAELTIEQTGDLWADTVLKELSDLLTGKCLLFSASARMDAMELERKLRNLHIKQTIEQLASVKEKNYEYQLSLLKHLYYECGEDVFSADDYKKLLQILKGDNNYIHEDIRTAVYQLLDFTYSHFEMPEEIKNYLLEILNKEYNHRCARLLIKYSDMSLDELAVSLSKSVKLLSPTDSYEAVLFLSEILEDMYYSNVHAKDDFHKIFLGNALLMLYGKDDNIRQKAQRQIESMSFLNMKAPVLPPRVLIFYYNLFTISIMNIQETSDDLQKIARSIIDDHEALVYAIHQLICMLNIEILKYPSGDFPEIKIQNIPLSKMPLIYKVSKLLWLAEQHLANKNYEQVEKCCDSIDKIFDSLALERYFAKYEPDTDAEYVKYKNKYIRKDILEKINALKTWLSELKEHIIPQSYLQNFDILIEGIKNGEKKAIDRLQALADSDSALRQILKDKSKVLAIRQCAYECIPEKRLPHKYYDPEETILGKLCKILIKIDPKNADAWEVAHSIFLDDLFDANEQIEFLAEQARVLVPGLTRQFITDSSDNNEKNEPHYVIEILQSIKYPFKAEALIEHLSNEDMHIREKAAQGLAALGIDKQQLRAIKSKLTLKAKPSLKDMYFRSGAYLLFGHLKDKDAIAILKAEMVPSLLNPDFVKKSAIKALTMIADKQAKTVLRDLLTHKEPYVRSCAVEALGKLKDQDSLNQIRLRLKDPNQDVRYSAVFVLGCMKDADSFDAVTDLLNDTSEKIRYLAAGALVRINPEQAKALFKLALQTNDNDLVKKAVFGLFLANDSGVKNSILQVFPEGQKLSERINAIRSLGEIGDDYFVFSNILIDILKDDPDHKIRREAAYSLAKIINSNVSAYTEELQKIQRIASSSKGSGACIVLGLVYGVDAIERLIKIAKERDIIREHETIEAIIEVLGQINYDIKTHREFLDVVKVFLKYASERDHGFKKLAQQAWDNIRKSNGIDEEQRPIQWDMFLRKSDMFKEIEAAA